MAKNVLVALGGGTTQVINASVHGLVDACKSFPSVFDQIYAGRFGIEGVLQEELLNLSAQPEEEIALLSSTPASGVLGSCRYRLDECDPADFDRLLQVFRVHGIGYFFYIGGNDSMLHLDSRAIPSGETGEVRDGFGHPVYSAMHTSVAQILVNHLNHVALPARGVARYNIPGTGQRNQAIMASSVDITEAYQLGQHR